MHICKVWSIFYISVTFHVGPTLDHASNFLKHVVMPVDNVVIGDGDRAVLEVLVLSLLNGDASDTVVVAVETVLLGGPDVAYELASHSPLGGPVFVEELGGLLIDDHEGAVGSVMSKHVEATTVEERVTALGVIDWEGNGDCIFERGLTRLRVEVRAQDVIEWRVFAEVVHDGAECRDVGLWIGAGWLVEAPELCEIEVGAG